MLTSSSRRLGGERGAIGSWQGSQLRSQQLTRLDGHTSPSGVANIQPAEDGDRIRGSNGV